MRRSEKILILEDDPGISFILTESLGAKYHLESFDTIRAISRRLSSNQDHPDLIIADLMLKDGYFTDYLNSLPKNTQFNFPFLVISSIDDPSALKFCFEKGALDYLVKPFKKNELLVKVERLLDVFLNKRKAEMIEKVENQLKNFQIDLTTKETRILKAFLDASDNILTREELIIKTWGDAQVTQNSINVHLTNLRRKLKDYDMNIISLGVNAWRFQHIG